MQLAWILFVLSLFPILGPPQPLLTAGRIFLVDLSHHKFISNKRGGKKPLSLTGASARRDMEIYSIWRRRAIFLTLPPGKAQCSQRRANFLSFRFGPFYIFLAPFLCLRKKVSGYAPPLWKWRLRFAVWRKKSFEFHRARRKNNPTWDLFARMYMWWSFVALESVGGK
jgi:hypothetical protein